METNMLFTREGRIGYALGGGAARGLFHIGVLGVLEEHGIYPDVIAGTSMGAIIGALYASGLSAGELKKMAIDVDWKQLIRMTDIALPVNGLIQGKRITSLLKSILKDTDFAQLKKEFACVATDLTTGEEVVINQGSLIDAVRASISIPLIFTPIKSNGRFLVDGGLVNVVPVSVCRAMGANFVIGVNVLPGPGEKVSIQEACEKLYGSLHHDHKGITRFLLSTITKREKQQDMQNTILKDSLAQLMPGGVRMTEVISQTFTIVQYRIAMDNIKEADLAILPFTGNIGFWQFNKAREAINAGEISARLALQRDDIARIMLQRRSLPHS
jgi:NTE family protein